MIKAISEVHRSEIEIDPKINLVDTGSKNEIKVTAVLQLQPQKVATTPQQRHFNPLIDKLQKQLRTNYDNKIRIPN